MCPLHSLSDAEVLATVIGPKTASHLLKTVGGSLAALLNESIAPYDVDPRVQTKLLAAKELVRRSLMESLRHRDCLGSPEDVRTYLKVAIGTREYEVFVVLFLDAQNRVIATEELFRGTLTQTAVYPREIVKRAMARNAAAVIFAHNHPSGLAEPSRADELLTGTLKQALSLVDVKVLDHIVIGGERAVSFAERGLL